MTPPLRGRASPAAPPGGGLTIPTAPRPACPATRPYEPTFLAAPYEPDFDRSRYRFTDDTGPLEVVLDTGPLDRVVDTSPFERIVIPGATSTFDAFAPPARSGGLLTVSEPATTYRGRRRRRSSDEHPAFPYTDAPPRGRRHRRTRPEDELTADTSGRHHA
ncbi:hypothetical protein ACFQES_29685 [Nonomuraea salmonea]|uniref:hypothetical protein n=1 Tax=Nonomuraea salmonea TaxID=46181 RepID=UPI00361988F7